MRHLPPSPSPCALVTAHSSLAVLLFTCICGLMMNDVLYIETSASQSSVDISEEDKFKNNVFGIVTLVLNIAALTFIIFTVLPEYRVIKRVISLIQQVCRCSFCCCHVPHVTAYCTPQTLNPQPSAANPLAEPHSGQDPCSNHHHPQENFGARFRGHGVERSR